MYKNIEAERARLGLTKKELAKALGISDTTYGHYVRMESPIPSNVLVRMAGMFKCSVDYLLGRENA